MRWEVVGTGVYKCGWYRQAVYQGWQVTEMNRQRKGKSVARYQMERLCRS